MENKHDGGQERHGAREGSEDRKTRDHKRSREVNRRVQTIDGMKTNLGSARVQTDLQSSTFNYLEVSL